MTAAFLKAAIPEPVTCLGVRLKPFSIGHWIWLWREKSPFTFGHYEPTPADLMKAVMICGTDWDGAREVFSDPDLDKDLARWKASLNGPAYTLRGIKSRLKGFDFSKPISIFQKYVEDSGGGYTPESRNILPYFSAQYSDIDVGSPAPLMTLTTLTARCHQPFQSAINMPFGLARWMAASWGEQEGQIHIHDREEAQNLRAQSDAFFNEVIAKERSKKNGLSR